MAAGGGHKKRGFLSVLGSGLANALDGILHKRDSAERAVPEGPVPGNAQGLPIEPTGDEPAADGSVSVKSTAGEIQKPPELPLVEEASVRPCADEAAPEESDCPETNADVRDGGVATPELQTEPSKAEALANETHEGVPDVTSPAANPTRPLAGIDMLSLADLGIASFSRLPFEQFGIYMVTELLLYRREELIELRGVTQKTLSMIELRVASRIGQPFHLQGSLESGAHPRRMTREEMVALDKGLSELKVSPLVARQLRKNHFFGCRQIAFTSRDELLDFPGIDLETTYELEEALGELLGARVVLGCDRGEPPMVAEGEPAYDWRLLKGESEEPTASDDVEEWQEDSPDSIVLDGPMEEPYDESGYEGPFSSELAEEASAGIGASLSDATRPHQSQGSSPGVSVDGAEDSRPEAARAISTTTERQSGDDLDDDGWDDVFGFDDEESEWDDSSKWDWNYGDGDEPENENDKAELPDFRGAVGVAEWLSSQDDVSCRLLLCLLDGMTKTQAAAECKVPASSVDFLVLYGLNRRPPVREDGYAYAYKNYEMGLEEFIDIFGQPALAYRYLSLTCEPGTRSISEMLDDEHISNLAKDNLRLRLGRANPISQYGTGESLEASEADTAIGATSIPACALDVEGLRKLRVSIEERAVSGTEYSTDFFYNGQSTLMAELGIETSASLFQLMQEAFKDSPEVTFHEDRIVRFGKADHDEQILALIEEMSPATFDDLAWQYKAKYGVERALFQVWLHKFYRYERNGRYDVSYVRPPRQTGVHSDTKSPEKSIIGTAVTHGGGTKVSAPAQAEGVFAEEYIELPSKMRNDLRGLATAILGTARMNTEYSTDYFYDAFPDLRRGLKVGSKRRFNEMTKLAFKGCRGVSFPSAGYFIRFGECDRDRQIISLMKEMSPVTVVDLRKEYERRYGVSQTTLYGWFYCIREYRKGDTYAVEYGPATTESTAPKPVPAKKPIGVPPAKVVRPSAPMSPAAEATTKPEQPSQARQEARADEQTADRNAMLRSIREAIGGAALPNTEYSIDYFYEALPGLVASIHVGSKMDFYHLVKEAYQGIEGVRFPMGHVMLFGDGDRDRQMLALLKELSPSQPMDLAIAYEKRYGFSRYLVQRWYRKYSEYLDNGYYTYGGVGASDDSGEDSPVAGPGQGEDSPPIFVERTESDTDEESVRSLDAGGMPASGDTDEIVRRATPSQGLPKVRTALEWALSLEGNERQVVQQTLFGNPLYSVAANASLSLKETSELLISAIRECPTVREDSFLIHFRLSKSMREFCASTGESEATYQFLSWRSKAQDQGTTSASEIGESGNQVQSSAAEQRRQMRRAARAESKVRQFGHAEDGSQTSLSQGEQHDRPTNGYQAPGPSRLAIERRVVSEVDRIATMGREYAPAHFYRVLLSTMKALGIHSDDELLDIMRHACRRDPDVSFVEGNVIRFGKCDRRRQLEGLLAENPTATLDRFVSEYERKYGFGKARITGWLTEYGIDLPEGKSLDSTMPNPIQSSLSFGLSDVDTRESQIHLDKPLVAKKQRNSSRQAQMELPISTKRVGKVSRTTEYADFLRAELTADCCDRRLVAERFRARFPNGPEDPFSEKMLWRLGFRAKGKKLLFREGIVYEEYFEGLIDSRVMFARGDAGFENAIFNDPQFRKIVRRKMRSYDIVEYEKDSFISTAHLCEQMGVAMEDIQGYSQDVVAQLRDRIGAPAPFTVWSLRNQYGIRHPLDALKTEGGMSDFVYETLFDIDPHVQCCTISKRRGFLETDGDFDTGNFIECLVEMNGPMEIDDLIDLLRDAYGIDYPELPLHHTISMSSLYYDDITDSVFNSRHEWEEMVNRELA